MIVEHVKRSTGRRGAEPRERAFTMSGEEVRATLAGQKTQARRVIPYDWFRCLDPEDADDMPRIIAQSPLGVPGDRLYVRETWRSWDETCITNPPWDDREEHVCSEHCRQTYVAYAATPRVGFRPGPDKARITYLDDSTPLDRNPRLLGPWRSPATMPRGAARLVLTLTAIRVEHVQSITVDDIIAEGVPVPPVDYSVPERPDVLDYERRTFARDAFMSRWDRDHKHHPEHQWSANPWVWVPEFTVERTA
jgi:hypothetical protein